MRHNNAATSIREVEYALMNLGIDKTSSFSLTTPETSQSDSKNPFFYVDRRFIWSPEPGTETDSPYLNLSRPRDSDNRDTHKSSNRSRTQNGFRSNGHYFRQGNRSRSRSRYCDCHYHHGCWCSLCRDSSHRPEEHSPIEQQVLLRRSLQARAFMDNLLASDACTIYAPSPDTSPTPFLALMDPNNNENNTPSQQDDYINDGMIEIIEAYLSDMSVRDDTRHAQDTTSSQRMQNLDENWDSDYKEYVTSCKDSAVLHALSALVPDCPF